MLRRIEGRAGRLTLDRPAALNALNRPLIDALQAALDDWRADPAVALVVLDGAGDRGFCAGGDLVTVYQGTEGDPERALALWRAEYALDATIAGYPKPVVVVMDGITMGGGLGLGGHAAVRLVTERSVLALPEAAIGLAPDVGGALLLARAPGRTGTHLALTAGRMGPADALYTGLADHAVPTGNLAALRAELAELSGPVTAERIHALIADRHRLPLPPPPLAADRAWIDPAYAAGSVPEILAALRAAGRSTAAIEACAPTAVAVALAALRRAEGMTSLAECLRQDYRVCSRFLRHPDLREGIRAALIDKDRAPRWTPATAAGVSPADVAAFFAPLADELPVP